jgi:hypothetical protein
MGEPTTWHVTYSIEPEISIAPIIQGVEELNLVFRLTPEGLLKGAIHTVHGDGTNSEEAFNASESQLRAYWMALSYRSRRRLKVRATDATAPETRYRAGRRTVVMPNTEPVLLPDPRALVGAPERLETWLWLANAARATPNGEDKLRNYQLILEDMGELSGASNSTLKRIRLARNFVSHSKVDRPDMLRFLKEELDHVADEYRYDPHNEMHRKLVNVYWRTAHHMVERALGRYLE